MRKGSWVESWISFTLYITKTPFYALSYILFSVVLPILYLGWFFSLLLQLALLCSRIASTPSADNIDDDNWKLHLTLPNKKGQEPGFCNFPVQGSALTLLRVSLLAYQMTSPLHFKSSHQLRHTVFVTTCFGGNIWLSCLVFWIYWGLQWRSAAIIPLILGLPGNIQGVLRAKVNISGFNSRADVLKTSYTRGSNPKRFECYGFIHL